MRIGRDLDSTTMARDILGRDPLFTDWKEAVPSHVGQLFRVVRKARGWCVMDVVDRTGFRRRKKAAARLESFEETGRAHPHTVEKALTALDLTRAHQQDWLAMLGLLHAMDSAADRMDRVGRWDDALVRIVHPPVSDTPDERTAERVAFCDALGFLMENREAVQSDMRLALCQPRLARYVVDPNAAVPLTLREGALPSVPDQEKRRFGVSYGLPLHLLLDLWADGTLVVSDEEADDPLHIVSLVGSRRTGQLVVEGITRRTRRWVRRLIQEKDSPLLSSALRERIRAVAGNQGPTLWSHFRLYSSYRNTLETFQRRDLPPRRCLGPIERPTHPALPPWASWLGPQRKAIVSSWNEMVVALERVCAVPLTDPRWAKGFPGFEWIGGRSASNWLRWHTHRYVGSMDARAGRYTSQQFEEVLTRAVPLEVTPFTLDRALDALKTRRPVDRG